MELIIRKKVAEAIAKGLDCAEMPIEQVEDISDYDLICIGTPVHSSAPGREMKRFLLEAEVKNKKAAVFCTYTAMGNKKALKIMKEILIDKGAEVIGEFSTYGRLFILRRSRPNEGDLKEAEEFGESLL